MSDEQFDRDAYTIELLNFLAGGGRFEGDQMGAEHTLDQISVAEDLIEMGYMRGQAIQDGSGVAVCIGGPGITGQGRKFLKAKRLCLQRSKQLQALKQFFLKIHNLFDLNRGKLRVHG